MQQLFLAKVLYFLCWWNVWNFSMDTSPIPAMPATWVPRKQTEAKGSSSPFSKKNLETVKKLLRSFIQVILLWSISIGKTLPYTLTLNPTPSTINIVPGIKPRASHVVAECPTTKPHPTPSPVDLHIWNLLTDLMTIPTEICGCCEQKVSQKAKFNLFISR